MALSLDRLTDRERSGLGVCAIVAVIAVMNIAVAKPLEIRFREVASDTSAARNRVTGIFAILSQQYNVRKEFDPYTNKVTRLASDEDPGAPMLTEIEATARGCNLNVLDRKSQQGSDSEFFREQEVSVTMEGTMKDIMTFLHKIETSPQLLRVARLDITVAGAKTPGARKMTVVITKMFQK